jgi:hypothetical protein
VVELVGDDRVALAEEHLEHPAVGVEARGVEDRRLGAEEGRQAIFEQGVLGLGAADEAHRCHPETPLVEGRLGCGDDVGVIGQAEVVVGAEVEHGRRPTTDADVSRLRRGELTLPLVEPRSVDLP